MSLCVVENTREKTQARRVQSIQKSALSFNVSTTPSRISQEHPKNTCSKVAEALLVQIKRKSPSSLKKKPGKRI
jgi:hypothetical protein